MTTLIFNTFSVQTSNFRPTEFSPTQTVSLVFGSGSELSYGIDAISQFTLPRVSLEGSSFNIRVNDVDANLLLTSYRIGAINWDGNRTEVIEIRTGASASASLNYYVVLGGDPFPEFQDFEDYQAFYDSITGYEALTGAFAPDQTLDWDAFQPDRISQNDRFDGTQDNDSFSAGGGNDTLSGGDGNDVLSGSRGNDRLNGGTGQDELFGQGGRDRLYGDDGRDKLYGGSGKDWLFGGKGNDLLTGGEGADRFVFRSSFGDDVITDFDVDSNREKIDLRKVRQIADFDDLMESHISRDGRDLVIDDGRGNTITLQGVSLTDLSADDFLF